MYGSSICRKRLFWQGSRIIIIGCSHRQHENMLSTGPQHRYSCLSRGCSSLLRGFKAVYFDASGAALLDHGKIAQVMCNSPVRCLICDAAQAVSRNADTDKYSKRPSSAPARYPFIAIPGIRPLILISRRLHSSTNFSCLCTSPPAILTVLQHRSNFRSGVIVIVTASLLTRYLPRSSTPSIIYTTNIALITRFTTSRQSVT